MIFDFDKNQTLKTKWLAPVNRIDFTLDLSNKKVHVNVQQTKNNAYVKEIYLWANKFVVIDSFNLELVTSSTGWVETFNNLIRIQGINGNILRQAFAAYYLERKDDLIFSHEDNFKILSRLKKRLVYFIVRKDGFLTVNYAPGKQFYVGNELRESFSYPNFIDLCPKPNGSITNRNIYLFIH